MTTTVSRAFVAERAYNLAVVQLTARDEVKIRRGDSASGIDVLVAPETRDGAPWAVFGVQVVGRLRKVAGAERLATDGRARREITDTSIPVVQFLFTMDDDRGYYRWIREPVLSRKAAPALREPDDPHWIELDPPQVARIFAEVEAWYRAQPQRRAA
jgi:hypothetical protein